MAERAEYRFPHSNHLSPTQVTEFLACPACFKLSRIDRVPKPLSVALPIGGAVHKAVELVREVMLQAGRRAEIHNYEGVLDVAADHFDHSLEVDEETGGELLLDLGDYGSIGEAKDHAVAITRYVLPEIAKVDAMRGLAAAELDLKDFDNPWPFPMYGRVDALYSHDGEFYTAGADLKSASKQVTPNFAVALQAAIYRSFIPATWFVDQVAKTKTPSFCSYALSDDGDEFVRELVLDVADRICKGDFPARPGFLCKYVHPGPSFSVTVAGYHS